MIDFNRCISIMVQIYTGSRRRTFQNVTKGRNFDMKVL